ncbi:MAG TPA: CHRD domain-containing protein [Thermoanaerobaculia bacterium]
MKRILLTLLLACTPLAAFAQQASLSATLSGQNGAGLAVVRINGTTLHYSVIANVTATQAHIHRVAGDAAVVELNVNMLTNGTATISQALANELAGNPNGFYVDVDFQGGSLRGTLAGAIDAGTRTAYLPVVGKVTGANNTNFVTDLRIINHGAATANVTLDYFGASAVTRTVTVAPGEQKVLDDLVGGTLQTTGLGALRVTSDQNVTVTARVLNDLRGSNLGTTGFAVTSRTAGEAETSGTISFLSQSSGADITAGTGFRTNLGYFNPNTTPVTATFTARRTSDGTVLGTNTVTIPANAMLQQGGFALLSNVPDADRVQPNFYVTWTASAPLFVYGSVVDNKTGDSVLVE